MSPDRRGTSSRYQPGAGSSLSAWPSIVAATASFVWSCLKSAKADRGCLRSPRRSSKAADAAVKHASAIIAAFSASSSDTAWLSKSAWESASSSCFGFFSGDLSGGRQRTPRRGGRQGA